MATGLTKALLGDLPMLVATGDLDRDTCQILRAEVDKLFAGLYNIIMLDLTAVTRADGEFAAVLRAGARTMGGKGWFGLIGMSPEVRGLLETEGLLGDPRMQVFKDRQDALGTIRGRQST